MGRKAGIFLAKVENNQGIDPSFLPALNRWTRWSEESSESRKTMDGIITSSKNRIQLDDWKSPLDILIQKIITGVLVLATAGAVWRYVSISAAGDCGTSRGRGLDFADAGGGDSVWRRYRWWIIRDGHEDGDCDADVHG